MPTRAFVAFLIHEMQYNKLEAKKKNKRERKKKLKKERKNGSGHNIFSYTWYANQFLHLYLFYVLSYVNIFINNM